MATVKEIAVPDIGGAKGVSVIEMLVQPGDRVEQEQGLITLETDKATMEVPSPHAGTVKELKVAEGDTVSEGSLIALLDIETEAAAAPEQNSRTEPEREAETPAEPETEIQTTEAETTSVSSPVTALPAQDTAGTPVQAPADPASVTPQAPLQGGRQPYASPSIRKLARELNVSLEAVTGSGPKGRITREDVYDFVKTVMAGERGGAALHGNGVAPGTLPALQPWPQVDFARFGPIERRELSRIRMISGANLHRNWVTIPHVTNHEDADITELEAFRKRLNEEQENRGTAIKVTLLALMIKACVAALKAFPEFNASLDGEKIVLKGYYHIGFAVDTPNGLVVPVVRDADQKGVLAIARETAELAAKAREGKLSSADMSGGCFSISSLGGIGGTYFTPIINAPEVAILGVSKARTQLIWNGEETLPRLIVPLSLSWDHRVVDGAMAGRFNAYLALVLADFRRILL